MTDESAWFPAPRALASATLALAVIAALVVRPSSWTPGISELELTITRACVPLLAAALVLAAIAAGLAWAGQGRLAGLFEVLSLLLINLAGLLTSQYGTDGVGLVGTLAATAPVAFVAARRETAFRRSLASPAGAPSPRE